MSDIKSIVEDGFRLTDKGGRLTDLAVLSLRIALNPFFSTYQCMKYSLHLFDSRYGVEQGDVDTAMTTSYCELSAETIMHFQHFSELICKEFLREEHPLLAEESSNRHVILHKLLKNEDLTAEDQEGLKSVEFKTALERLCSFENRMKNKNTEIIVKSRKVLEGLNNLRNRLWHRGTFILRYPALDRFTGQHMLPFVKKAISLPVYKRLESV